MKPLISTERALVLRTDFSNDAAWTAVCAAIQEPNEDGFQADVDCVSDRDYAGLTVEQLVPVLKESGYLFAFAVDTLTLMDPEWPVLVIDLNDQPGRTFRVLPGRAWSVENNLSLANMDYHEFAEGVDPDGVFRGFPGG